MGNFIIKFLDHNGMRPIIVLVVIVGGIFITLNSKNICVIQEPLSPGNQSQIILRDNPVCSKYFEMAALIIGGILGLTVPGKGTNATNSTDSTDSIDPTDPTDSKTETEESGANPTK